MLTTKDDSKIPPAIEKMEDDLTILPAIEKVDIDDLTVLKVEMEESIDHPDSTLDKTTKKVPKKPKNKSGNIFSCFLCEFSTDVFGELKKHRINKHGFKRKYAVSVLTWRREAPMS